MIESCFYSLERRNRRDLASDLSDNLGNNKKYSNSSRTSLRSCTLHTTAWTWLRLSFLRTLILVFHVARLMPRKFIYSFRKVEHGKEMLRRRSIWFQAKHKQPSLQFVNQGYMIKISNWISKENTRDGRQ